MTAPRQSREDRSGDQLLAGKYALGLLSEEARRHVEARMRRDRDFARMVMHWNHNMAFSFDEGDMPRDAMRRPMAANRNNPRRRRPGVMIFLALAIWRSAAFWRFAAFIMFILVLTLLANPS